MVVVLGIFLASGMTAAHRFVAGPKVSAKK